MPRNGDYEFYINGVVEEIKDGYVVSGKYEGKIIRQKNPVFVGIFTNSRYGDEIAKKFSADRIVLLYFKSDIDNVGNEDDLELYYCSSDYRRFIVDDMNKEELIINKI